jgi:hypothetical protein
MRGSAQHRQATVAGCRNSERSQVTRQRVGLVIDALARLQRADLILPRTHDMGLAATLGALAAATDPSTPLGDALRATLARSPKALAVYCRRNREFVRQRIAAAAQTHSDT